MALNFLHKREMRNDVAIFKRIILCCNLLGLFPHYATRVQFCIISLLWMIMNSAYSIWYLVQRLENETKITSMLLWTSQSVTLTGMVVSTTWGAFRHQRNLQKFFKNITKIDSLLKKKWCNYIKMTSLCLKITFYHVILFGITTYQLLSNHIFDKISGFLSVLSIILLYIIVYQKFLIMLTMTMLGDIFSRRYEELENVIADKIPQIRLHHRTIVENELEKLKSIHYLLDDSVKQINAIFGLPILILIMRTCTNLLYTFNEIMLRNTDVESNYWIVLQNGVVITVSIDLISFGG